MATMGYIKIDAIQGEGKVTGYEDQIGFESISMPFFRSIAEGMTARRATGNVTLGEIVFTRFLDAASPYIAHSVLNAPPIPTMTITLLQEVDGEQHDYLVLTLTDVIFTNYQLSGSGSAQPMESFGANYLKIEGLYKNLGDDYGPGGEHPFTYDLRTRSS